MPGAATRDLPAPELMSRRSIGLYALATADAVICRFALVIPLTDEKKFLTFLGARYHSNPKKLPTISSFLDSPMVRDPGLFSICALLCLRDGGHESEHRFEQIGDA